MWRTILAVAILSLAFGGSAAACPSCGARTVVSGVSIEGTDSAQSLVLLVQAAPGQTLPESGTVVLMQFNGSRSKCINAPVLRGSVDGGGNTVYRGSIPTFYGGSRGAVNTFSGRVDLAGDVYEFTVMTDGKPGVVTLVTDGTTVNNVSAPVQAPTAAPVATPAAVATTAPTAAPASAPQPVSDPWAPLRQPMTLLALLAIAATIAGAFIDRRRALAKATA